MRVDIEEKYTDTEEEYEADWSVTLRNGRELDVRIEGYLGPGGGSCFRAEIK